MKHTNQKHSERGAALIFALMALGIFSILGTAYLGEMVIANEASEIAVNEARARLLAEAGIRAAIGELDTAIEAGQVRQVLGSRALSLPTYHGQWNGESVSLEKRDDRVASSTFVVTDENAKVNVNHAPPSVLRALLGVDGATARKISGALREDPVLHPDDLVARGLLTPEQYESVQVEELTTYTVMPGDDSGGHININSASPVVLAAIADVPVEQAARADQLNLRPFKSIENFAAAMDQDAAAFNLRPNGGEVESGSSPLTLESRCFRIQSEGVVANLDGKGEEYRRTRASVEAVVMFDDEGRYQVVHWSGQRSE